MSGDDAMVAEALSDSDPSSGFRELRSDEIIKTIAALRNRINDRFPGSSLAQVCQRLYAVSLQAKQRSQWIRKPIMWLRVMTIIGTSVFIGIGLLIAFEFIIPRLLNSENNVSEWIQVTEAGINELALAALFVMYFFRRETSLKRRRALEAIHEIRSIAHIIDMHQLTKDPERILSRKQFESEVSPEFLMTQFELRRYLDYCSEMLSLTGKIGALYVQHFDDSVALSSANELELLTTGLSRKIWQKILILHTFHDADGRPVGEGANGLSDSG